MARLIENGWRWIQSHDPTSARNSTQVKRPAKLPETAAPWAASDGVGFIRARESGKRREMCLITKLAWFALPALAGCSMLLQVSSQGTGTKPGGKATLVWNGEPIAEEDLVELKPESDGTLRVPVVTKEGKIDPFWKLDSASFLDQPIEAGKAPSLSVGSADAKTQVIISKPESEGKLSSKKFEVTSDMKKLQMRIIGNGDMTSTYVRLLVSIDGKAPIGWAQQAPTSARIFEKLEWDLSKVLEAGESVTAQIYIVDGSKAQVIGIGETSSTAGGALAINNTATNRAFFTFPNLLLGPNLRYYQNHQALVRDGEQYAKYFGVKTIDSQKNFGMPKEDMYAVLVEVNKLVASPQFDHNPSTWKQLPVRLTDAALSVAVNKAADLGHDLSNPANKADFDYFVKLQAIHEWVRSRFEYSLDEATGRIKRTGGFSATMAMQRPSTVCGGFSWAIVYFATAAGLDNVLKIEGSHKRNGDGIEHTFDHSWNAAILPSGSITFVDAVRSYYPVESGIRRRDGVTFSPFGFGLEGWQLGFFLNYYHNQTVIGGRKIGPDVEPNFLTLSRQFGTVSGVDYFTSKNWNTWYNLKTSPSLMETFNLYYCLFP